MDRRGPVLRLEVRDGGATGQLRSTAAPLSAESGRGLAVVASVATRWGSLTRGCVTCVHAELAVADPGEQYATA